VYCLCSLLPKDRIDNVTERQIFGQIGNICDTPLSLLVVYRGRGFHSKSKAHYKVLKNTDGFQRVECEEQMLPGTKAHKLGVM